MTVLDIKGRPKDEYCEHIVGPLFVRVGLVFESGNSPKNAQGMIRHPASPGREKKWDKLYFPQEGAKLLEDGVSYAIHPSMEHALFGDLVLALQGNPDEARSQVVFGRLEESVPFEFSEGSSFLPLRIYRFEESKFKSLYIRYNKAEGAEYFVLLVVWEGDKITLKVFPRTVEQVPEHLVAWQPYVMPIK